MWIFITFTHGFTKIPGILGPWLLQTGFRSAETLETKAGKEKERETEKSKKKKGRLSTILSNCVSLATRHNGVLVLTSRAFSFETVIGRSHEGRGRFAIT